MRKTTTTYPARIDGLRYEIETYELWMDCFIDSKKSIEECKNAET